MAPDSARAVEPPNSSAAATNSATVGAARAGIGSPGSGSRERLTVGACEWAAASELMSLDFLGLVHGLRRSAGWFDESATHDELAARLEQGAEVEVSKVGSEGLVDVGEGRIAMFVHTPGVELRILTAEDEPRPDRGDELIGLGPPP